MIAASTSRPPALDSATPWLCAVLAAAAHAMSVLHAADAQALALAERIEAQADMLA